MNFLFKKRMILVFIIVLFVMQIPASYANDARPVKLVVNGGEVMTDVPPLMMDGRTMVPVRFVSEALGASVSWDQQAVLINSNSSQAASRGGQIQLIVNGSSIKTDVPPVIMNGRTMVPVRFVSEALGAAIVWDQQSRTVFIQNESASNNEDSSNLQSELILYDSFQHVEKGQEPADYTVSLVADAQAVADHVPAANNRSLFISAGKGTAEVFKQFKPIQHTATIEFKFMQRVRSDADVFQLLQDDLVTAEIAAENGNLIFINGSGEREVLVSDYSTDIWYTLKMVVNVKDDNAELFLNEFPVKTNEKLNKNVDAVNALRFLASNDAAYYIDDLLVGSGRIDIPMGFAAVEHLPTGGIGGETYIIETLEQFLEYARKQEPLTMKIAGTIDMEGKMHQVGSNKTMIGTAIRV